MIFVLQKLQCGTTEQGQQKFVSSVELSCMYEYERSPQSQGTNQYGTDSGEGAPMGSMVARSIGLSIGFPLQSDVR